MEVSNPLFQSGSTLGRGQRKKETRDRNPNTLENQAISSLCQASGATKIKWFQNYFLRTACCVPKRTPKATSLISPSRNEIYVAKTGREGGKEREWQGNLYTFRSASNNCSTGQSLIRHTGLFKSF